jgi:tRNA pseudouridine13 synthase
MTALPWLSADQPGVGGRLKEQPEDFEVEEIPAYEPCGVGEHLYLWIEKRDVAAEQLLKHLAARLGVPQRDIGTAGLKDRRAVTRQWLSVPATAEPRLADVEGEGVSVLRSARHGNKLRPGHLHGNRFRVLIRDANPDQSSTVSAILQRLATEGLPNYYGPQRFGRGGETLTLGWSMLRGQARFIRSPFLRKLALSAVQSQIFNDYLAARLQDGLLRTVLAGDVMAKRPAGGMFVAEDLAVEQQRFEAGETVPAGPIFGRKTFLAAGQAAEREAAILAAADVPANAFERFGQLMQGTRRHNLVFPGDLTADWKPEGLRLSFTLPPGSYATVLLREVMKDDPSDGDATESDTTD